ncbi:MAG TPA: Ig-like domain-containing protein [Methanoregulaceae archaeon]|nr:Ig-like domain-containing protein [Methanoregulaceae archaeon]
MGDDWNYMSGDTVTEHVLAPATNTLTSVSNPSKYGDSVTFTSKVTGAYGNATGTVTFKDGSDMLGSEPLNSTGVATFTASSLSPGNHNIIADYSGNSIDNIGEYNSNYSACESHDLTQVVQKASTTVTLTSSSNPSQYGHQITFTANVNPHSVPGLQTPATGTVQLKVDGLNYSSPAPLQISGTATIPYDGLSVGDHAIEADYSGDDNFTSSSGILNPNQDIRPSIATVSITPYTVTYDGNTHTATGTAHGIGGVDLSSDLNLAGTRHTNAGTYANDVWSFADPSGNYTSQTGTVSDTIGQAQTSISVTSNPASSVYGQPVRFAATVAVQPPGVGIPGSGGANVTFCDSGAPIGNGTWNSGGTVSSLIISNLNAGASHSITAKYSGSANFLATTSTPLTYIVNKASTNTTVSCPAQVGAGAQGSLVAIVSAIAPGGGSPTGSVQFFDKGVSIYQVPCDTTGIAKYLYTFVAGSHSITASYLGDSNFTTSTSPQISPTVTPDPVIVAFTPLSGSRGTTVMIMIKGNYIQTGATANLTLNGNRLPITTSAIKPPIMLSGSVTIPTTVTPGQWILSVTNPDGGTVQRIFTVT